jgi:hypothetical protein
VTEEVFAGLPSWFDTSERNIDEAGSYPFDRVREIKRLLFKIHHRDEGEAPVLDD